ncbi:hypothetical protein FBZ89_103269 [Nitrospirillum amazonense]|uniref:Uncharacterized protein n=1 Tax=Nitrospirillum amazonense TaxID=28077 RepID=A0A560FLZ8_9PROT|nr:hypothetical protein [Nitrospirillum amazonense]TWB22643.1 hypothetical protein FBZ89_103269 [Nitrospirillum amazonense]
MEWVHIALGAIGSAAVATAKVVEQQQKPCTVTRSTIMIPNDKERVWALLNDYPNQGDWRHFAMVKPTTAADGQTIWRLDTGVRTQGFFRVRRREAFTVASCKRYRLVHRMLAPVQGERSFILDEQQGHGRIVRLTLTWTGALYHRKRLILESDRLIRDLTSHFHRAR